MGRSFVPCSYVDCFLTQYSESIWSALHLSYECLTVCSPRTNGSQSSSRNCSMKLRSIFHVLDFSTCPCSLVSVYVAASLQRNFGIFNFLSYMNDAPIKLTYEPTGFQRHSHATKVGPVNVSCSIWDIGVYGLYDCSLSEYLHLFSPFSPKHLLILV